MKPAVVTVQEFDLIFGRQCPREQSTPNSAKTAIHRRPASHDTSMSASQQQASPFEEPSLLTNQTDLASNIEKRVCIRLNLR